MIHAVNTDIYVYKMNLMQKHNRGLGSMGDVDRPIKSALTYHTKAGMKRKQQLTEKISRGLLFILLKRMKLRAYYNYS